MSTFYTEYLLFNKSKSNSKTLELLVLGVYNYNFSIVSQEIEPPYESLLKNTSIFKR